jgi:HEAT repeat protein
MFDWLKDKVAKVSNSAAADALRKELRPLDKLPKAPPRLVDRVVNYIVKGDGESVLADLASLKNTHLAVPMFTTSHRLSKGKGLVQLLKELPQDPEFLLRLAKVYDAAQQAGTGVAYSYGIPSIPAFQGSLSWLGSFLIELSAEDKQNGAKFPVGLLLAMIDASGEDRNVLLKGAFFYEDAQGKSLLNYWTGQPFANFRCLDQFPELVLSLPHVVRPAFQQKETSSRANVLRALRSLNIPVNPFVEEIAALAVSGSKEVRESAAPLIAEHFQNFNDLLKQHAEKGSAEQRYHAVGLLARSGGESEREFLTQRLNNEKSEKVRAAIQEAVAEDATTQTEPAGDDYQFPEVPEVPVVAPLDKNYLPELRDLIARVEKATAEEYSRQQNASYYLGIRTPVPAEAADRLFAALQTFVVGDRDLRKYFDDCGYSMTTALLTHPIPPHFQLIHVIRWCLLISGEVDPKGQIDQWDLGFHWAQALVNFRKVQKKPIDLRELAAVFKTLKLDEHAISYAALQHEDYISTRFLGTDPESIWPFFAERLYLLEEAFAAESPEDQHKVWSEHQRQNAFNILKSFPRLPSRLVQPLWKIALSGSKHERFAAQACLENFPNKEQKIVAALESPQPETRTVAAQWLAALGYTDALPPLKKALAKEKSEGVKDELLKSLETLGVPLDELVNVNKLDAEAEKGLKKGIPKDLDWFPFAQLPTVAWADSNQPVPTTIVHWFILQGYKTKNAEANPTLRRYCSLFRKEDREKLGKFILEAWIAEDTKPKYTPEQAAAQAQKGAQQNAAYAKQYPQYYPDFDEQRVYQILFNSLVTQPGGSQNSTKGILAVSGACCGADVAPIVHRYVKQWYGHRAAQCKALLQVLVWIEHPLATQVVLSVANRFRTKGIQEEALRLCQLLAQRKGWTMDELADRTIPTVGLDETGTMELDYGTRQFTATLSDEMAITLTNQNGKVIASLPDGNQSDDPEKVKQAKSALASARKELKTVLTMLRDRLYEGLCTQRTWRFEDWDFYLRQHPIVGRYCQRLVWVAYDGERVVESFRPLPDGTLTNQQDDEVKLAPDTLIRLGHDETLPAEDRTAWLQHFSDYEVEPLFQQFGKQQFTLTEAMKEATEITDFLGYIVKAFTLRNRLTRLGYTRAQAQDAGWFYEYRKKFLRLGLEAVIEFTGNGLPEENRTVALKRLFFTRKNDERGVVFQNELELGELPRVLISECWNDIRMAAADGPGFAADWEKQTEL